MEESQYKKYNIYAFKVEDYLNMKWCESELCKKCLAICTNDKLIWAIKHRFVFFFQPVVGLYANGAIESTINDRLWYLQITTDEEKILYYIKQQNTNYIEYGSSLYKDYYWSNSFGAILKFGTNDPNYGFKYIVDTFLKKSGMTFEEFKNLEVKHYYD